MVTGKTLIVVGLHALGFVGFVLFGTNLAEARHQDDLRAQLREILPPPQTDAAPAPAPAPVPEGDAVAILQIPSIGVDKAIVEGVELPTLKKGPGHYPGTPLPGQPGNSAIAGHRTTYGAPFFNIDEVKAGDDIFVTTRQGRFHYDAVTTKIVKPTDVEVVAPTPDNRLTLTSCNPRFSAAQRIVLVAQLVGPAAPAPPPAAVAERPTVSEVVGAASDPKGWPPTIVFGLVALAIGALARLAARRWKRWPSYLIASVPFLLVLFLFYENLARVVPS